MRVRIGASLLAVLALALAACSGSGGSGTTAPTTSASSSQGASCTVDERGVPTCEGALWGIATRPPTYAGVRAVEEKMGRTFDIVYRYHDLNDEIPDKNEQRQVAEGKLLHLAIAARDFGHADRSQIGWSDVASGSYDDDLRRQAQGVASLKVPVFVTFEQEASQQRKIDMLGTPAEFVAAWRRVHDIFRDAGASNAVWVWVMTGSEDNLDNAAQLWPGNEYVDWISWNVYNQSGCKGDQISQDKYISFEDKLKIFYDWVYGHGPAIGMDPDKPKMVSETGSARYVEDLSLTGDWYESIPGVLKKYPTIRAITLWDSVDEGCDYRFDQVPELTESVKKAGLDPYVNIHPKVSAG